MGSCCGTDAPTPPNPLATAAAQTGTNVSTAIANAYLNSTNQITPTGNLTYNQTSTQPFTDPSSGNVYQIPRFTATQTLSPNQQTLQDTTERSKINLANLSADESGRMLSYLGNNFDPTLKAPAAGDPNSLNVADPSSTFGGAGDLTRTYGGDNLQRGRVEQSMFDRLNPQLDRQRAGIEQHLADQGIRYGSAAYTSAMDDWNRQSNDARLGVIAQGGQEQQLQENIAAQRAGFQNAAQQQDYTQQAGRGTFANQSLAQQMAQRQNALSARNSARAQSLQEQYAQRGQPINEISALLSQSQVSQPQFQQTPTTQIPTTDIAGLINTNFNQQFQNYQTQQQSTDRLLGGILGAGSNIGAAAFRYSDKRLKKNIHRVGTVFAAEPQPVEEPATKKLPIYQYSYKDDPASTRHVGPMAQDVEKVDPSAVTKDKRGLRMIDTSKVMGSILRAA